MTFVKLHGEAGGKERNTAGPADEQGSERWRRECQGPVDGPGGLEEDTSFWVPPPCAEVLHVPLWQYKEWLRTCSAEPSRTSCLHGLAIHTAWLRLWGKELEKEGRGGLKIVPLLFLQLSFMEHKPAWGLPAPIHIRPYIMGDTRAWPRAGNRHQPGNRQGRDIYATLPKPMSSSGVSRPWKQPVGWGRQLVWLSRATQPQPQPGEEARESRMQPKVKAGLPIGCWQKSGPACQATVVLLEETAVGRSWQLWGGLWGTPQ